MTVITISRQFGSYGDEIARKICEVLEYHYFDKELIMHAAASVGLSEEEIVDFSEEDFKVQNFLQRLLEGKRTYAQVHVWKENKGGIRMPETVELTETAVLDLIQKAIYYAHQIGNVVIVGRGGQVLLQNEPDVLHVRIEAPFETRLLRVRKHWLENETQVSQRRMAQDLIVERDEASANYLQHFYQVRWDDPSLYHLIINTEKLGIDQAVNLLTHLTRQFNPIREEFFA